MPVILPYSIPVWFAEKIEDAGRILIEKADQIKMKQLRFD